MTTKNRKVNNIICPCCKQSKYIIEDTHKGETVCTHCGYIIYLNFPYVAGHKVTNNDIEFKIIQDKFQKKKKIK